MRIEEWQFNCFNEDLNNSQCKSDNKTTIINVWKLLERKLDEFSLA